MEKPDTFSGKGKNSRARKKAEDLKVPSIHDWRTTDEDEVNRRKLRAMSEPFAIRNLDASEPVYSNFSVKSGSGMTYQVEIRDIQNRSFSCSCIDFRINGLGTCKHVEGVLNHLQTKFKSLFKRPDKVQSPRWDLVLDANNPANVRMEGYGKKLPRKWARWFDRDGVPLSSDLEVLVKELTSKRGEGCRVSQEIGPILEARRLAEEQRVLRREYESKVQTGEWPQQETLVPLFPYQREGMLHLAFKERALLADEMGLGKTIQAIAAAALLHRLGKVERVLVVTPASLKTEWEEQISKFTSLSYGVVYGGRQRRLENYLNPSFFTIVNYEQMVKDSLDVNQYLRPDLVILDEAQRIKNWNTKTAQAVKRLKSRYAFVLTGTPIENRIDELHSLMDFINPSILGPLFRFNRDFYHLDERGRPEGYKNLGLLHEKIRPYLIRRRKADVEAELPDRVDRNHFVKMSPQQASEYSSHAHEVKILISIAKRRALSTFEREKLMRELAMMRMLCDSIFILDQETRFSPKIDELEKIIEECLGNEDVKVIVFSEWERMLQLVRELCERMGLSYAWHTGTVPQKRRRAEINLFKNDPNCRFFLSTDAGSTGLNLQNASVVVNCDLPWNPAKLEQRIARAWRKNQLRAVTVINLISEDTIEHGMLETLSNKAALATGVLDLEGELDSIPLKKGMERELNLLSQVLSSVDDQKKKILEAGAKAAPLPVDRELAFAQKVKELAQGALVRCEERYPVAGTHSVMMVVVNRDSEIWRERLQSIHQTYFGPRVSDSTSPTQLMVIEESAFKAVEQMEQLGMIARTLRSGRVLYPGIPGNEEGHHKFSDEEIKRHAKYKDEFQRRIKVGSILWDNSMESEALPVLISAMLYFGKLWCLKNFRTEPEQIPELFQPPLAQSWGEELERARDFAENNRPELALPIRDFLVRMEPTLSLDESPSS